MKKNWFECVTTLQALKIRYKELAKAYHPDRNPSAGDEAMQQINAQYDELVRRLSKIADDGRTEATAHEQRAAQDLAAAYRFHFAYQLFASNQHAAGGITVQVPKLSELCARG